MMQTTEKEACTNTEIDIFKWLHLSLLEVKVDEEDEARLILDRYTKS